MRPIRSCPLEPNGLKRFTFSEASSFTNQLYQQLGPENNSILAPKIGWALQALWAYCIKHLASKMIRSWLQNWAAQPLATLTNAKTCSHDFNNVLTRIQKNAAMISQTC